MSFETEYTLANDGTFVARMSQCALRCALQIIAEDEATLDHAAREELARKVVSDPNHWGLVLARGVVTNPTISTLAPDHSGIADGDLEFVMASIWGAYADA